MRDYYGFPTYINMTTRTYHEVLAHEVRFGSTIVQLCVHTAAQEDRVDGCLVDLED